MTEPTAAAAYGLAQSALDRIDRHERDCIERGKRIEKNQEDAKAERKDMHVENRESLAAMGARVDRMYGRAWGINIVIMTLLGSGLLYFVKAYLEAHP